MIEEEERRGETVARGGPPFWHPRLPSTGVSPHRTVIVVLGARSGTSAFAGTLGLIGCTLPKNLMSANWANSKGYFEPQDLALLHDEILDSVGSIWSDWREFPSSWFHSAAAEQYCRRLAATFEENYGQTALSVLKEPRMCRMLPLWDEVFKNLAVEPVFCFVERNPFEVAASLQSRDGSSLIQGILYYLRNHLDAEHATRSRMRVFVSYDDFLGNWRKAVASISETLGIRFPGMETHQAEVDTFLDPGMRHQVSHTVLRPEGPVYDMADAVHAAFGKLSAGGSESNTWAGLDQLRAAFNGMQQHFG
jgi:hypothetical protein